MTTQILDTRTQDTRASFIPLSRLSVHEANVRRTDKRAEIESLAASIAAHGLLQNLSVVAREDGRYAVVAGSRRLGALKLLVKQGRLPKDFAAPCQIVAEETANETSLAENIQRVAMNVMDEVEAFERLTAEGLDVDAIAQRFGVGVRHVTQRLALARLSPKIKAAYRKGDVGLDAARAFTIADDHAAQDAVFKLLAKPIASAQSVRAALTQGRVPAHDRLVRFVGLGAYEAGGGRLMRDLFVEDVAFCEDADLLRQLAADKLEREAERLRGEGWGWVETHLGYARTEGCANERARPTRRAFSEDEQAEIDALDARIEELDTALEDAEDNDTRWEERDRCEAERAERDAAACVWDPALIAHAGVAIGIENDGRASFAYGLVKRADVKTISKLKRNNGAGDDEDGAATGSPRSQAGAGDDIGPRLPRAIVQELTTLRAVALRAALSASPHTALALIVHQLHARSVHASGLDGVEIASTPVSLSDDADIVDARATMCDQLSIGSAPSLKACLDQSAEALLAALALFVAETLDLVHVGVSPGDARVQAFADALAAILDLDMTRSWSPDTSFWTQVPKALTLAALRDAPKLQAMSESERQSMLSALAKMKKADLAAAAAAAMEGADWLPDLLVTPPRAGAFAVTGEGEAAINASVAAA